MTCPNIYLAPDLAHAPPTPVWTNPAINPASDNFTVGTTEFIPVSVRNNGTDNSPLSRLELFWSDPATSFTAVLARRIGFQDLVVPGATTAPPADGVITHSFAWDPPAEAAVLNDGHVCLLARVENLVSPAVGCMNQTFQSATPWSDPRSAIHNVHVAAKSLMKAESMAFGFAAQNPLPDTKATELVVRVLDPKVDRERLEALVGLRAVRKVIAGRPLKFASPKDVALVEGRGRVVVNDELVKRLDTSALMYVGRLGEVSAAYVERMTASGKKAHATQKPLPIDLVPGERMQTFVQIELADRDDAVYALEIEHRTDEGTIIGGLTVLFVTPQNFF